MSALTTIMVNMAIECPTGALNTLRRDLDHHVDYLIDMDTNRDRIKAVYGVKSYVPGDASHDNIKLDILNGLIRDILMTEPNDDELQDSPERMNVYAELHNLKTALAALPSKGGNTT